MNKLLIIIFLSIINFTVAYAGHPPMKTFGADFNKMKSLAGDWTGKMDNKDIKINYKVSSAGSSIIETFSPGTPMEMVSVYTEVNGKINMTHYCAFQNQPTLELQGSTKDTLEFDYIKGTNMNVKKDAHMHHLSLKFKNKSTIEQHWTKFEGGKSAGTNVIKLSRIN